MLVLSYIINNENIIITGKIVVFASKHIDDYNSSVFIELYLGATESKSKFISRIDLDWFYGLFCIGKIILCIYQCGSVNRSIPKCHFGKCIL